MFSYECVENYIIVLIVLLCCTRVSQLWYQVKPSNEQTPIKYVTNVFSRWLCLIFIYAVCILYCYGDVLVAFDSKQKRAFHSILSGLKFALYGKKIIRFLTLTTSVLCRESVEFDNGSINSSFQIFRKRVRRYSPHRLYKEGYISAKQLPKLYSRNEYFKKFSFEYFKVETNEGNGVLHILYRGSYLPYNFIVDNWQDIHMSYSVDIQKLDLSNVKDCAGYIVSQYLGSQKSSYVRSSQSWNWFYRGFKSLWHKLRLFYPQKCFILWEDIIRTRAESYFYPQCVLSDYG